MNNYAARARIYRHEFAVRDDFGLLRKVLAGSGGMVVDAPAGAGRLMDLHAEHHRRVVMVDLEPAMTAQCVEQISRKGLAARVRAVEGDLRHWQPPQPASHVIIARGGLQVLPSREAIAEAVRRSAANLEPGGILYIDIALPGAQVTANQHDLPLFMRFAGGAELHGHSLISLGDGTRIRRSYRSVLHADRMVVDFTYESVGRPQRRWQDFQARTTWVRLQPDELRELLADQGLGVQVTLGDYAGEPYAVGSSRFICMAIR